MEEYAIQTGKLRKVYKGELREKSVLALDNLDLEVRRGEVFAFIGPNGAGKTTTIKLLLRLIFPTAGWVRICGEANTSIHAMKQVGYLPEQPRMYEYLSGREFLHFIGRLFGLSREENAKRTLKLLEQVGLGTRGDELIRGYSRGMMQRLGLAQALMNDPELLILDEPMASLDPVGRKDFRDFILSLKERGTTIFFSSHILSDAEMIAERVGILTQGRMVRLASLTELTQGGSESLEVSFTLAAEKQKNLSVPAGSVRIQGDQALVRLENGSTLPEFVSSVYSLGGSITSVTPVRRSLEEIFMAEVRGK
jgi:ABC-2 type transport system ATP-binding protein